MATKAQLIEKATSMGLTLTGKETFKQLEAMVHPHVPATPGEPNASFKPLSEQEQHEKDAEAYHIGLRRALGSGFIKCAICDAEVSSTGENKPGLQNPNCDADHAAKRRAIGSGYLVCDTCGHEIPNV